MKGSFSNGSALDGKPVINKPVGRPWGASVAELKAPPPGERARTAAPAKKAPGNKGLREGVRLFNLKRWEDALQELLFVETTGFRADERSELFYYLGLCFTKVGKPNDAMPNLEKVVAGCGDALRVYQCRMALAYIHVTSGRPKMAEYELKRLMDSGFESAMIFNTMAFAAYSRKHYRHAIEYYEKALKLEDGNATALNGMGYILVDTGIDPLRGLKLCRKAVELQPKNAAYLDSLGWACYKCREPTTARNWLRKAIELAPQEIQIREHLRIVTGGVQ